ncbi:hypothetical protein [Microvirga alba]|uniref:Uncharacterized protein n=1 Tax=Microvirga alba TaxID=2791025 RepID=A0A931BKT7_9HYPH|nr:hypothetical protein [Microvirga alba]MBF9232766.1 hypothetical protein [Microvirga alba]
MARDPRSEAEKARADLARNDALGMAVPESPAERGPSVTPETFGDTTEKAKLEEDLEQSREAFEIERDDGDSTGTGTIPKSGIVPVWPEGEERPPGSDEDVLSRAKE